MTTVTDIIKQSLKDIGVIGGREVPTDDEMQDGMDALNQMLSVWRTSDLIVYCQKQVTISTTGVQSYTVGTGGDIDIERPVTVDAMYWRLNNVDTSLKPIHSFEDYQDISLKALASVPNVFYYRPDYPLGQLFVWPIPTSGSLVMTIKQVMPQYLTIQDDISLPPEYEACIRFNLAVWCASSFGKDAPPRISQLAQSTLRAVKRLNTQLKTMRMPDEVMRNSYFNIYSGQGR